MPELQAILLYFLQQQSEGTKQAEQPQSITPKNPEGPSLQNLEMEDLTSKETSKLTLTDPLTNSTNDSHKKRSKSARGNPLKKRKQNLETEDLTSKETSKVTLTDPQTNATNETHKKRLKLSRGNNPLRKRKQEISPPQSKGDGKKVPFCEMLCSVLNY